MALRKKVTWKNWLLLNQLFRKWVNEGVPACRYSGQWVSNWLIFEVIEVPHFSKRPVKFHRHQPQALCYNFKSSKAFGKLFFKNGIFMKDLYSFYFKVQLKLRLGTLSKYDFKKIVITNFRKKNQNFRLYSWIKFRWGETFDVTKADSVGVKNENNR